MGIILESDSILNTGDSGERNKKQKEYYDYIVGHIDNVRKCYELYFRPLLAKTSICNSVSDEELKQAIITCDEIIKTHDDSKFGEDEFDAYRVKYYPTKEEENLDDYTKKDIEEKSEQAWKHHYQNNDHHPMYWVDEKTGEIKDMSLEAIIHMLCDWEAMSIYHGGDPLEWYNNKADKEKSCMSPKTKDIVEELLFNVLHC